MDPIIILLVVVAGAMFWMSSRQRKTQREAMDFIQTLQPGTRVTTASGYIGTVVEVSADQVTLESVPGEGRTTWLKAAIRSQVTEPDATEEPDDASSDAASVAAAGEDDIAIPDYVSKLIDKPDVDDTKK